MNRHIFRKPEIVTECIVSEPTSSWLLKTNKEVIWRENKTCEFQHWIDLTDRNLVQKYSKEQFVRIDFEIDFDDLETEQSYEKHVQTLLNELPEFCQNGDIVFNRIVKMDGKDVTVKIDGKDTFKHEFHQTKESSFQYLFFPLIDIPMKFAIRCAGKIALRFCAKRIVVKKVVSNKNLEVAI